MSIFAKIFGQAPVQGQQPVQQQQTNNIQTPPTQTATQGNGTVPNNGVTAPAIPDTSNQSPLDAFNKLWETDPNAAATNNTQNSLFNVDPAKLQQAVSKADFTKTVSPDLLKQIAAGGEGAVAALQQTLNAVAGSTFVQQTQSTTKILEQALKQQREAMLAELPNLIKQHNVSDNLRTKNPIFSHPAAAPMLELVQQQMQQKHPGSTATEIQSMAENFLTSFAEAAQGPAKVSAAAKAPKEDDWSSFIG